MSYISVVQWLIQKGFAKTSQQAQELVHQKRVYRNGFPLDKGSTRVHLRDNIFIKDAGVYSYVSRGAQKLASGFQRLNESVVPEWYVDVGASTGGFTDYLLRQGAQGVVAVDVGHHQLHERLQKDPRVISLERTHVGKLRQLPKPCHRCVADVSFTSLKWILPPVWDLLSSPRWCMMLFKPQFELPRKYIQRGGVVGNEEVVAQYLHAFISYVKTKYKILDVMSAPCEVRGKKKKNQEYWVLIRE